MLAGGVLGSWQETVLSDAPRNGNHPDAHLPVAWSGSEYRASDWQRAQKFDCPKGVKAPVPAKD